MRPPTVLIVDDEAPLRHACAGILERMGYATQQADDGHEAARLMRIKDFDVIISDIHMPGMDGINLLRAVREHDLDLPVILITGEPALETAMKAIEFGALRYLVKPFNAKQLQKIVSDAVRLHRFAKLRRQILRELGTGSLPPDDRAGLEASFTRAIESLTMAFQPIVSCSKQSVFGWEALARPKEPSLPHPGALFAAAERLMRLDELGRTIRERVALLAMEAPAESVIFINLHPRDLLDETLYQPDSPLAPLAHRTVLEITERATLDDITDLRRRVAALREMGFRIAIDDLGAGYAGLTSFAQLEPEVVKLDRALIQEVDQSATKQKLIRSLITLCGDMGQLVIAEGIERPEERDVLIELGCDLLQGYLFASPAEGFREPAWQQLHDLGRSGAVASRV